MTSFATSSGSPPPPDASTVTKLSPRTAETNAVPLEPPDGLHKAGTPLMAMRVTGAMGSVRLARKVCNEFGLWLRKTLNVAASAWGASARHVHDTPCGFDLDGTGVADCRRTCAASWVLTRAQAAFVARGGGVTGDAPQPAWHIKARQTVMAPSTRDATRARGDLTLNSASGRRTLEPPRTAT